MWLDQGLFQDRLIKNASEITVKIPRGGSYSVANIDNYDEANDVALLRIDAYNLPFLMPGSSWDVAVGTRVYVVGNPQGLDSSLSDGIVSARRMLREAGFPLLQITAPISSGSSGSPVLDQRGRVVGVATLYIQDGQNLNFAQPIEYVTDLMDRRPLMLQTASRLSTNSVDHERSFPPTPTPEERERQERLDRARELIEQRRRDSLNDGPPDQSPDSNHAPQSQWNPDPRRIGSASVDLSYRFDKFTTNLSDDSGTFVQMKVEVEVTLREGLTLIEHNLAPLRDATIMLLSSKTRKDVQTLAGKERLKRELMVRYQGVLGTARVLRNIYVTEFTVVRY